MNKAVLLALLVASGCYSVTGRISVVETPLSTLRNTDTINKPRPDLDKVELSLRQDGMSVHVEAQRVATCERKERKTYDHDKTISRKLPWDHWLVLGAGVALLGGGVAAWANGATLVSKGSSIDVGTPSQERDYDRGKRLVPWGIGLTSTGGLLLTSELVDALMAMDKKETLPSTDEIFDHGTTECRREPAAHLAVLFRQGKTTVKSLDLDTNGRGQVDLADPGFIRLPFRSPFLVVECDGCAGSTVALPPDGAADFVLKHDTLAEYREWLTAFPSNSHSAEVRDAEKRLADRLQNGYSDRASALMKKNMLDEARAIVDECRREIGADGALCLALGAEIDTRRVTKLVQSGKVKLAQGNFDDAISLAGQCQAIEPGKDECIRLKGNALLGQSVLAFKSGDYNTAISMAQECAEGDSSRADCISARNRAQERYDDVRPVALNVTAYEDSDGYRYYFTLRNKRDELVASSGHAVCYLGVYQNGFLNYTATLSNVEVKSSDFKSRSVGRGLFARSSLLFDGFVKLTEIYAAVSTSLGGYDDNSVAISVLHSLRYDQHAFFECKFKDVSGTELSGRDEVWFR